VGWVAEVGKPILNGNPDVEPGFAQDLAAGAGLASALALPLVNGCNIVGVLALYRNQADAFAAEELVSLLELCPRLAGVILETEDEPADLTPVAEPLAEKIYC
jgi:GAF domain-containing protein